MACQAWAQAPPDFKACLGLAQAEERLACYDHHAGQQAMVALPAPAVPQATGAAGAEGASFLARYWELGADDKRGTFNYTAYRPNFFLPLRVMRSLNHEPNSPTRGPALNLPHYQRGETKLQLSMRTKVMEGLLLPQADLWVAYTQQSMWQLWNQAASAPFRNSDFQPELIYVVPVPAALQAWPLAWRWRLAQLGLVHQSNGQSGALSRSWNRVYAAVGLEQGDVTANLRLEQRTDPGSSHGDDNPDIVSHLGRLEAQLNWSPGRATSSLLWRPALRGRGSVQLDWTYPVSKERPDGLRWYGQVFNGFGETMLDYNFRQTSVGLGLTLFKF